MHRHCSHRLGASDSPPSAAALELKGHAGATAGQYLISYVEMATDRYLGFRFPAALTTINTARKQLKDVNPATLTS